MANEASKKEKPKKGKLKLDIKDPNVRNVLIGVGTILLLSYLWFDSFYSPKMEEINALTERKEKIEAELLKINALKPQLERLRQEAIIMAAKLDSLKNIFPDQKEVPRLIREITAVNRRSGVITTRFTPMPDVEKEYYIENRYNVSMLGDYHNLGALFSYFANFQLIVNLDNVAISANPGYGGGGKGAGLYEEKQPTVLAVFELTTFSSRK
ncbi:MAG: type 4a pilus biogenesis protein PilO [Chitinispirillales bacterium]|jgi:type IV pilus assembly protein PilO|nr:type 4a pilus biogenesis protein PilO [Chitinispirillales bacterium]